VSRSGLLLNCSIISRGQMSRPIEGCMRPLLLCVSVCFERQINWQQSKKIKDTSGKVDPFGVQKHKRKHGFTGDFNKPQQKQSITLQNSMFVSPESYKSQHEIHHDFTFTKSRHTKNLLFIMFTLSALGSTIGTAATLFSVFSDKYKTMYR